MSCLFCNSIIPARSAYDWQVVQVMVWYQQTTSHYLNQWWPSSMSPYSVIRPRGVNTSSLGKKSPVWVSAQEATSNNDIILPKFMIPHGVTRPQRPNDTIWRHRPGSILSQVYCVKLSSHYLSKGCCITIYGHYDIHRRPSSHFSRTIAHRANVICCTCTRL